MSCKECESEKVWILNRAPVAYFPIGNGKIALIGCKKHEKKLRKLYPILKIWHW